LRKTMTAMTVIKTLSRPFLKSWFDWGCKVMFLPQSNGSKRNKILVCYERFCIAVSSELQSGVEPNEEWKL
jgi:hypothetical protein